MLSTTYIYHRTIRVVFMVQRLINTNSKSIHEIEKFFNTKQYRKVLDVFNEIKTKKGMTENVSNKLLFFVLKACGALKDHKYAIQIHHSLSTRITNDDYLSSSMIHLYMQCGDLKASEILFDASNKKSSAIYGAMMKGYLINSQPKKAIDLFYRLKPPSEIMINLLFNACAQIQSDEALNIIRQVSSAMPHAYRTNSMLMTSLIDGLMKCGDVTSAESIFIQVKKKSLPMYGAMMKGYIQNNLSKKAVDLFSQARMFDEILVSLLFNACAHMQSDEALQTVKQVLSNMPQSYRTNPILLTSLIDAMMKCSDLPSAESLFNQMKYKTLSVYGAMMKGYIQNHLPQKAVDLFHQINNPNEVIFIIFFNACARIQSKEALEQAKMAMIKMNSSFLDNESLVTSLLNALTNCGDVELAESIFTSVKSKSLAMYGAMMKGHITNGLPRKAIDLFHQVNNPTEVMMNLLFNACSGIPSDEISKMVHDVSNSMPQSYRTNPMIMTSLIDTLIMCGDFASAKSLFDKIEKRTSSIYGAMMKGYIKNNEPQKAIDLFHSIENPDHIIVTMLFNACAQVQSDKVLTMIKQVYSTMPQSFRMNSILMTSLIDAMMKCGDITFAKSLFDQMKTKSLSTYGAMMKGYLKNNVPTEAIQLFHQVKNPDEMIYTFLFNACSLLKNEAALQLTRDVSSTLPDSFKLNSHLVNSILDAYVKCGDRKSAEKIFEQAPKSVISYGILMNGSNEENEPEKTLALFDAVKSDGIEPDKVIYLAVINALSRISMSRISESIVEQIPKELRNDLTIQNALLNLWAKTGFINRAKKLFEDISSPNHYTYTMMIHGYGLRGMADQALELFKRTPSQFIDDITYLCVLNACSHSGFVDKAQQIFESIPNRTNKIYTAMIDCLSRAGIFDKALELIDEFERAHPPTYTMYMAVLSGARNNRNAALSEKIVSKMKILFPDLNQALTSASILLANVYGSIGDMDRATDVRDKLIGSNTKRVLGASWTAPDGKLARFFAHDRSHPRVDEIYAELHQISKELIDNGHQYDSSWVTRPLHEGETIESALSGHSERLAIAWNFVVNAHTKRIEITKNLRVCGDCHRSTKLLARIRNCEILVRDANRFHHFTPDGQCSCGDYF